LVVSKTNGMLPFLRDILRSSILKTKGKKQPLISFSIKFDAVSSAILFFVMK
jgi:hypothetical protein